MPQPNAVCLVCQGPTLEIRGKLVCRRCGAILETCCEGGPMGTSGCPQADDENDGPDTRPSL
jgi:hypothetical protein